MEAFEVISNNNTLIRVEPCHIDNWSVWAMSNKLLFEGVKVSLNGHSYILGFNAEGEVFGSILGKRLYQTALRLHNQQVNQ